MTNNHVIEGASEATVRLNDGRSYSAVLVGTSSAHDLAVLRINVAFDRPPPVPVGTSGDLRVGHGRRSQSTPSTLLTSPSNNVKTTPSIIVDTLNVRPASNKLTGLSGNTSLGGHC